MTNEALYAKVKRWHDAKIAANEAVAAEQEARKAMCSAMFPDASLLEGTQYAALEAGWRLKGVFGTAYKLERPALLTGKLLLEVPEGKEIAAQLIKWKADVSVAAYKLLTPAAKLVADEFITTTPKLPSFELVAPAKVNA